MTDTGEAPAATTSSSATQSTARLQSTQTQISWQADDPDSDRLVYALYFRSEEETNWHLIRNHMFENTLLLDPDVFADGRYYFKVVASDAPANAPEFALESEMTSSPVLIDNTPPTVKFGKITRTGTTLDAEIEAEDKSSSLRLCASIPCGCQLLATRGSGRRRNRFAQAALSPASGRSQRRRALVGGVPKPQNPKTPKPLIIKCIATLSDNIR